MTKPSYHIFTYDEARARYTKEFTHTDTEIVNGKTVQVTYKPEAVCNNKEMRTIFKASKDWPTVLRYMRAFVGSASTSHGKGKVVLPKLED